MALPITNQSTVMSPKPWRKWITLGLLGAAFLYIWILPLFRPRGLYLWGHYQVRDIYLGIPIGIAALCTAIVMMSPAGHRRPLALRLTVLSITVMVLIFGVDIVYTVGYLGILRPNYYLDLGGMPRSYNKPDDEVGYLRKAGFTWYNPKDKDTGRPVYFRTDENGFRNALGIKRADIVFIGDSFTEAATVGEEDTFVWQVANASGLQGVNLGMGGYSPQQELGVLRRFAFSYNPRVIVWQIFEGNDINDAQSYVKWRENPNKAWVPLKDRYISNSLINGWASRTLPSRPDTGTVPAKLRYTDGEVLPLSIRYQYVRDNPTQRPLGFNEIKKTIEEGYRLCQSRGVQLVVVFVPTMVRVMSPYITFDRTIDHDRYLPGDVVEDERDFGNSLGTFCKELGCPYINTFKTLRERAATNNRYIYIPNDEHLDVEGHKLVAQEVLNLIGSQQVLSQIQK